MKGRHLDFKVHLPQLESDPGKFKGGVKRYELHKNEDSPALILGGSFLLNLGNDRSVNNSVSPSLDHMFPRRKRVQSISPSVASYDLKLHKSPVKFLNNDPIHNNLIELMNHPAFKQPQFTRNQPKIVQNDPILGYSGNYTPTFTSDKRNNFIGIGARLMLNDKF